MQRITPAVKHLLIINCIVFFGIQVSGNTSFFQSIFALFYPLSDFFGSWQVITHMFMHGNYQHLLFNMFALWMFGTTVETVFGQRKFLFFYISCGLGAVGLTFVVYGFQISPLLSKLQAAGFDMNLIQDIANIDMLKSGMFQGQILAEKVAPILSENGFNINSISSETFKAFFDLNIQNIGSMVGASGAIMGVLVAFGMLFPEHKLMLIFLPIPVKAKYFIPAIIGFDLFSALTGVSIFSPSNTAYIAHLGGALTGFLIMYFWKKNQFNKYRWN
jgi:membrane associated rhomboid family serine protease